MEGRDLTRAPARSPDENELLRPYLPRLVIDWLRERPDERYRSIPGTLVFADVSGFTRLTEMLSARGKIGAEEMAEVINGTFEKLLEPVYAYGAGLIKWGGDATLLLFQGSGHVERGCRAAYEMQGVMRRVGHLQTSRGSLRLRMSIGIHSGAIDFLLVGHDDHRELLVAGTSASMVTRMEKVAGPGQIVVSEATADALTDAGQRRPTVPMPPGFLLRSRPDAEPREAYQGPLDYADADLGVAVCQTLRDHILAGGLEGEHRHVTTGFVKFSGTDALLADGDPGAALAATEHVIRAAQAAAATNGVTFLATDIDDDGVKIMLASGAPRSFGEDEDRMIATARGLVGAGGVLPIRAGVNSGRTFAGDYGPPYRRTYSMMGDSVNTAARVMARAEAGELLITAPILEATNGNFITTAREPFAAKGKRAPVHTFSVGRPAAGRQVAADDETPMIGRDRELSVLVAAERRAGAGAGGVIEIVGAPGIGKSRLVQEFQARARAAVLWVQGDIYAGARPYASSERLLRSLWKIADDSPPEALAARLESVARASAPHLAPWLPLIGIAAGVELPMTPEVRQTDSTLRKQRLEELTSELLGVVLDDPTVLIFNDVHLMDDASIDLIGRLAADAPHRPWLVIAIRRPHGRSPVEGVAAETIELGPLDASAAERLLARATDAAPLPPHKVAALAERAAGNPLFLRELVAQVSAGGDPDALPPSVEGAIAARIDRLASADRRALRSASVLGIVIELALLDEVLGDDPGAAGESKDRLRSLSEFLEPAGPARWRFSHQLVREIAYEGLPYRRRTELHARTAAAIERLAGGDAGQQAELLSLHCLNGARYDAAWRYSLTAAASARTRYGNSQAAESYRRALEAASFVGDRTPSELAHVEEALGDVYHELGELDGADRALRRALGRMREHPVAAGRLELKVAKLRRVQGRHATALRWVRRAGKTLEGAPGADAAVIRGKVATLSVRLRVEQGRLADALASANGAIALGRESSDRATLAEALEYSDMAAMELGRPAGTRAEQALAIYEEIGELSGQARVRNTLGAFAYYQGRWPDALAQYRAAESAYTRCGMLYDAAISMANAAEILVDQGRLDEARDALERAMRVWRGVDAQGYVAFGEYQLGRIAARSGRTGEAMRRFDAARSHYRGEGGSAGVVMVDALTAECLGLAGDHAEALALADETLARTHALGGVAATTPLLHRVRGAALLALDRPEEAMPAFMEGLAAARSRRAGHEVAFTLIALLESGLGSDPTGETAWRGELTTLAGDLGIVI